MSDKFHQYGLYGRGKEITILESIFNDICEGCFEILLVRGMSGAGKTALISKVFTVLTQSKGYFLSGKFEQYSINEPYRPFVQAFTDVIHYMLTESKVDIGNLGKKLKSVLGNNCTLIAGLIPEIELIIGPQKPIDNFDIEKIRRRFERVFIRLIQVFASEDHPLILFLDDLQWADEASINLINVIANDINNKYLLLVCSYRENNSTKQQGFLKGTIVKEVALANLDISGTYDIIKNRLDLSSEAIKKIGGHIYIKTLGNPFYIEQIIDLIKKERIIFLNDTEDKNLERLIKYIEKVEEDQSVLDMVFQRIKKIFTGEMYFLKLVACVGNSFDLNTISLIVKETPGIAAVMLAKFIEENILLPLDAGKEIITISHYTDRLKSGSPEGIQYKFVHDKIHKAVYDLLDENEKERMHCHIGRILISSMDDGEIKNNIFAVISHINYGLSLIKSNDERIKAAELNYLAGLKAKSMAAFKSAYGFFKTGIGILPDGSDRELTYDLYYELYQSIFLMGKHDEAEKVFEILLKLSTNNIEKSKAYILNTVLLSVISRYQEAIEAGIKALSYLDIYVMDKHYNLQLIKEALKTLWLFRNTRLKKIMELQENSPHQVLLIFKTIIQLAPSANLYNQTLFMVFVLKMTNITANKKSKYSPIGLAGAAIFNNCVLGNYKKAKILEQLVLSSYGQNDDKNISCITYFLLSTMITHWTNHCRFSLQYAYKSFNDGLDSGELFFTGYAMTTILEMKYVMGESLGVILSDCDEFYQYAINMDFNLVTGVIHIFKKFANTLKDDSLTMATLIPYNLEEELTAKDSNDILTYYILEAQLYLLKGDYRKVLAIEEKAHKRLNSITGYILFAEHTFYYSLAITLSYNLLSEKEKRKYSRILKMNTRKLKIWTNSCSDNHMHKYLLIKAEAARIKKKAKAASLYEQAIESANRNGYVQNEAIINECTALYYKSMGRNSVAGLYINEAYKKYIKWGACAKSKLIAHEWKDIISEKSDVTLEANKSSAYQAKHEKKMEEDIIILDNIMDAYYMVMGAKDTESIFYKLLNGIIMITNSDKGYLLIEEDNELFVEAGSESGLYSSRMAMDNEAVRLPRRIIRYVARTQKTVIYNKNMYNNIFLKDAYIIRNRPNAIVCIPFVRQKELWGVIYLERNVNEKHFSISHVEASNILIEKVINAGKLQGLKKCNDFNKLQLTQRELEVLKLLAQGKSNNEIAKELNLTVSTIKSHLLNIYSKLGVNKRIQAVVKARGLNLID